MKTRVDVKVAQIYAEREKVIARMRAIASGHEDFAVVAIDDLRELLTALDVSDWSAG